VVLARLVEDALHNRPELAQAKAVLQADLDRVPQVSALPDPVFSAGIQNDGFSSIQIGEMETSWLSFMVSQTFPWSGKRDLLGEVITFDARQAEADLKRLELSTAAEVARAYVDLLLARDQLLLLDELETLWTQAEASTRVRYETGDSPQSDLLRAQLERSRLRQRRLALVAEEQRRVAVLNRLRGRPADEPITTQRSLADVPDPILPEREAALADAEARSPELLKSQLATGQSGKLVDLAEKDSYPDLTLTAGVMPRWGDFETMWQAGVSFALPIWGSSTQSPVIAENLRRSAEFGAEAIRQRVRERALERHALLSALLETNRLFRSVLLVQTAATVASTTAQYQVGRVTFASVLESLNGYVADISAYYESVAAIQRVDIAQREVSLDPAVGPAWDGIGGSMPGAGDRGERPSRAAAQGPALPAPSGQSTPGM
jgi:outer membrane protein TolC